jgi:hypothetical protein
MNVLISDLSDETVKELTTQGEENNRSLARRRVEGNSRL